MRNILKESKYHLEVETGWDYWFHLKHSIVNSYKLIKISFKSLVHGLLPFMWKSDAPKGVIVLYTADSRSEPRQTPVPPPRTTL